MTWASSQTLVLPEGGLEHGAQLLLVTVLMNTYFASAEIPVFDLFPEKSSYHMIHSLQNKNRLIMLALVNKQTNHKQQKLV